MSRLPRGWSEAKLGEVIELKYGKSLPKADRQEGPYNVYGSNGIVGTNETSLTSAPAIIVGRKGSFGEVNYSAEKCFPIDTTYYVDSFEAIDSRFCYALLKYLPLKSLNRATAIPGLNREDAYNLTLGLPPLAEQKRIVAKLDALNAKSARARTELARIETLVSRYKQAVLSKAFSGELTREWSRTEGMEAWLSAKPEDLFRWSSGKNLPSREYAGGSVPVIGGNGVSGYHNTANTDESTIVIGRVGALCGNVYRSDGPAWITDNAIYAKWISPAVDLRFAVLVYEVADLNKMSGGTGQPYVNQSILNSIDFPLPSIAEQHEIVRRVESAFAKIQRLAKEAKRALELVGKLDEVILAKAFRGELVPQDENDEPAELLLERIRAERETAPKAKRGRRTKA